MVSTHARFTRRLGLFLHDSKAEVILGSSAIRVYDFHPSSLRYKPPKVRVVWFFLPPLLGVHPLKKVVTKNSCYGRDLVITAKLAQFLTNGAQEWYYTNRVRILPSVPNKKNFIN